MNIENTRSVTVDNIKNTIIAESKLHGFGLFATKALTQSTIACLLDGQVLDLAKYQEIQDMFSHLSEQEKKYFFMECNYICDDRIVARAYRTKYSYINHSRTPNVAVKTHPLRIEYLKDIPAGEELTIDYRMEPLSEDYLVNPKKSFL